jgi:hypothetical protein
MTISPYQVNSILQAYSKQSKVKPHQVSGTEPVRNERYADVVSLSSEVDRSTTFNKISYTLLDVILKGKE